MAKETWALDLGEWSLKVARGRIDKRSGRIVIDLYDEFRYDALGVGADATNGEKFRAALRAFAGRYEVPKRADLCVAVPGRQVFSRFINLPPVPESISEIIRYEARQQIPFDMSEVVWDYQSLRKEHEPGEEIEVGLFALKREDIDELMSLLEPWRDNLRVVQDAPLALYNLLGFEGQLQEPMIVLDMGVSTTDLLVVDYPRFWLRPLLLGGGAMSERLQSHFKISPEEAERLKERASEEGQQEQVLRAIEPVLENMVSEIQRSIGYYKSLARGVKFGKILVFGNAFRLRGLKEALAEGLQYPVEELTGLQRFEFAAPLRGRDFMQRLGGACPALGLLVQGAGQAEIGINLLPEELVAQAAMARKKPILLGAAVGLLVIAGIFMGSEKVHGEALAEHLDTGEAMYNRLAGADRDFKSAQTLVQSHESKVKNLAQRTVDRDVLLRLIPDIAEVLPEDTVYVSRMDFLWMSRREYQAALKAGGLATWAKPEAKSGAARFMPGMMWGVGPAGPIEREDMWELEGGEDERPTPIRGRTEEGARTPEQMGRAWRRAEAAKKETAILVVGMECESTVVKGGLSYIQDEVIERLKERSADGRQVFETVELVGSPWSVFRRVSDGTLVDRPTEREDTKQFVAFRVMAQVNLGKSEGEKRPRTPARLSGRP